MSKAAEIELRLEKAQRKTAQGRAYFGAFAVGDRIEVTGKRGVKKGQILLTQPRFITVNFDGNEYKTTLPRADYLSGLYRIKKIEGEDTMAQRIEAPSKEDLEAKLLSHQGSINKLAKEYGVSWGLVRDWLKGYGLMESSRNLATKRIEEESEGVEGNEAEVQEPAELVDPMKPLKFNLEEIEYAVVTILEKLTALEQKIDALQRGKTSAQVEFKDVADLAERMAKVWTDARRI